MDLRSPLSKQLDAAVDENAAEDVDDPMEAVQQRDAGRDKYRAHDERTHHAPEKHFVLQLAGHAEGTKDQQEYEKVVDAERQLDEISGNKLQRKLWIGRNAATDHGVPEEVDQDGETGSQADPHRRPSDGLAEFDNVFLAMEDAQVERQQRQDKHVEDDPEDPVRRHARKLRCHSRFFHHRGTGDTEIGWDALLPNEKLRAVRFRGKSFRPTCGMCPYIPTARARGPSSPHQADREWLPPPD